MNSKIYGAICGIISMVAVVVFFIWGGLIEKTYEHSWIVFVISGIACAILGMVSGIMKEKKKTDDKNDSTDK
ncbi:MAG: hypothetical protein IJT70_00805 [Clostridia bacterium]|nr:hypothetical protein [Clostridia bacterium]